MATTQDKLTTKKQRRGSRIEEDKATSSGGKYFNRNLPTPPPSSPTGPRSDITEDLYTPVTPVIERKPRKQRSQNESPIPPKAPRTRRFVDVSSRPFYIDTAAPGQNSFVAKMKDLYGVDLGNGGIEKVTNSNDLTEGTNHGQDQPETEMEKGRNKRDFGSFTE